MSVQLIYVFICSISLIPLFRTHQPFRWTAIERTMPGLLTLCAFASESFYLGFFGSWLGRVNGDGTVPMDAHGSTSVPLANYYLR